ncbi:MAG TPA: DMT family transporter [Candidatus Limnocylindrales bacterium]|nr:DMT family transporter [Candidatus Limnocylindrales bacterium]
MSGDPVRYREGLLMLAIVVLSWGSVWPVHKEILESLPPQWLVAWRSAIATVVVFAIALSRGHLPRPGRADVPVVLSITLLHMVGFALLTTWGLQVVSAGRSVVLAYTTPLWVIPAARVFLGERLTARRSVGAIVGLLGLAIFFNPLAFDWADRDAILGNGAILAAALLWAGSIVHIRRHRWRATPFELVPWELLLATMLLTPAALASGRWPAVEWSARLVALLLYSGVVGMGIAYWAVATAGRLLPAGTVSVGLLATPVVSIAFATFWLGEAVTPSLVAAVVLILGGVACSVTASRTRA